MRGNCGIIENKKCFLRDNDIESVYIEGGGYGERQFPFFRVLSFRKESLYFKYFVSVHKVKCCYRDGRNPPNGRITLNTEMCVIKPTAHKTGINPLGIPRTACRFRSFGQSERGRH